MCRIAFVVLLGFVLLAGTTPLIAQQDTNATRKAVIIDTDMAVDDWLAILYLLKHPDVDVLAVTVSGTGEAHCDPGVQNTMNLVALAGQPDIPVACGREAPLLGSNTFPKEWRDQVDAMAGIELEANPNPPLEQNAADLLRETITRADRPVTLVTLGPLTNIAEVIQADHTIVERLAMIYVMGGAVDVPGNLAPFFDDPYAEWNIFVDPLAAAQVVESGVPMTFIPLDASNHVPVTMPFYRRLEDDKTTPVAEFVYQALSTQKRFIQSGFYFFWDPLAAVVATDESLVNIQGRPVSVIIEEGTEFGRISTAGSGQRVRVAVSADSQQFEQTFLNVLNGRDPAAEVAASDIEEAPIVPLMLPVEDAGDVLGIWHYVSAAFYFQFNADNTFRADQSLEMLTGESPEDLGTYEIVDGIITMISANTTRFCSPGDVAAYDLNFNIIGQLAFTLQSDDCESRRAPSSEPQLFDLISPDGVSLAFPIGEFVGEDFAILFRHDGTYSVGTADGATIVSTGVYRIKGNQLEWVEDSFCRMPAVYSWAYSDDTLTWTPVGEDVCAERAMVLSVPYTKTQTRILD